MVALCESMRGDHPARPVLVLSHRPEAAGLARARALGVPAAVVDHRAFGRDREAFEQKLKEHLDAHRPDIICLAGFMRILGKDFVQHYSGRMINIHPSLLPKYKGLSTHERAIAAGDAQAGCTVHEVTPALDDGPILGQARVDIAPDETPQSLAQKVLRHEHLLYPEVLRRFSAGETSAIYLP